MITTLIILLSVAGIAIALFYSKKVTAVQIDSGAENEAEAGRLKKIHRAIADGAIAFLNQEYRYMLVFMVCFAFVIGIFVNDPHTEFLNEGIYTAVAFVVGSLISILSGFIGMKIATAGNVRTASSARKSLSSAFYVALHSGAVMGFALVGLAGLGLILIYLGLDSILPADLERHILMDIVAGFGLGGSSIALFARVGGGIFTKAADVGADLVGKVEKGIPEDDPRNPAVIADNVGDNVGDVAGMGADLFGSCAESTCAAMVIGATAFAANIGALLFPILISALSIPISLVTMLLISVKTEDDVPKALKRLLIISSVLMLIVMYFAVDYFLPASFEISGLQVTSMGIYLCYVTGLVAGLGIGLITEYFTSHDYFPVRDVSKSCETGAATNIIFGMALGFKSTGGILFMIALSVFIPFTLAGMYGVAISSLGMLGTLVIGLTIDAYGPVADNAGGIAEMSGMGKEIRDRTDVLDASGNTTAAIGKGFAIGSAILTSLALYAAFLTRAEILSDQSYTTLNLLNPMVLFGLFIGTILPFLFSAMTMRSVGAAAFEMIEEVRSQFKKNPGIFEGTAEPDYKRCVAISTKAALKQMIPPGALIMLSPIVFGLLLGVEAVAGLLMGSLLVGAGLAIFQSNAGGAWDNAKKYIEKGNYGGKGSDSHKAAVVGDTVGDPFKDTSGPSLNILLKLSAILSLVFVPFFINYGGILLNLFK